MEYNPQAIQFSETPSKILLNMAERSRQEQLLRWRAQQEDEKIRNSLPMEFVNKIKDAESDVKSFYGKAYLNDLYTKIKDKLLPTGEVQSLSAKYAMDIFDKSSAVANFKKEADGALESIANTFGIDKARVKAQYGAYLYNNIMDPSKLGNGAEYVGMAIDTHPELFVDNRNGQELFNKMLKDAPTVDLTNTVSIDVNGTKTLKEVSGGKIPFYMKMVEGKGQTGLPVMNPVIDKDSNGVIPESIFNWFYNYGEGEKDYRMKTWVDAGANRLIIENNKGLKEDDPSYINPSNEGSKTIFQRKFVTDMLEQMKRYDAPRSSTVDVAKPTAASQAANVPVIRAFDSLRSQVDDDISSGKKVTQLRDLTGEVYTPTLALIRESVSGAKPEDYYIKDENGNLAVYAARPIIVKSGGVTSVPYKKDEKVRDIDDYLDKVANKKLLGTKGVNAVMQQEKQGVETPSKKKVWNPKTGKFE